MAARIRYEVYQDKGGVASGKLAKGWRFRAVNTKNGRIQSSSGEDFASKSKAIRAAISTIQNHGVCGIVTLHVLHPTETLLVKGKRKPRIEKILGVDDDGVMVIFRYDVKQPKLIPHLAVNPLGNPS